MHKRVEIRPTTVVNAYRNLIAERDAARTARGRTALNRTAARLRKLWKEWQGEDSLHELAFGKP